MKDIIKIKLLSLLCCLLIVSMQSVSFAEQETKEQNKSDGVSTEQNAGNDLEKYERAVEKDPDSDVANYNLGTAYYRKGEYEKSIDSFIKSLNTEDREIEAKAIYNIANSKYKVGSLLAQSDLNSAIGHYKESLDYYRRAMELDESDRDAKYNHELVEKKLKILLDKMKNQQQQQQDQDRKEGNDKENKEGQDEGQQQQQEEQKQQSEKKEQSGQDNEKKESGTDREQQEQEMQSAGKEDASSEQMSPEEARMLLEAYGQDEARDEVKQKVRGRYGEVLRDW
jgi:tetratricopeptide (TPR) repeat protein